MRYDDRKTEKTGPLALSQSHARDLATGIGQSKSDAMMTGSLRSMRVAAGIPATQRKAMCDHEGYPAQASAPTVYNPNPENRAAKQTKVNGRIP